MGGIKILFPHIVDREVSKNHKRIVKIGQRRERFGNERLSPVRVTGEGRATVSSTCVGGQGGGSTREWWKSTTHACIPEKSHSSDGLLEDRRQGQLKGRGSGAGTRGALEAPSVGR